MTRIKRSALTFRRDNNWRLLQLMVFTSVFIFVSLVLLTGLHP